jgi:acetyl esterase/lipase
MESFFAQDVVDFHPDLAYVPGTDNPRQYLDLYTPRGVDPYPVVVFVHGGFWIHQDKDYFQPVVSLYRNVGIALARRGIGTAVIDYRLVGDGVTFDDQFSDVAAAVAWVHDHVGAYGGDSSRMILSGHSAGGHITALAAFDSARLPTPLIGYIPLSPILDLTAFSQSSSPDRAVPEQVFGTDLVTDSPSTYFTNAIAPMLIVLGNADEPGVLAQVPGDVDELQALAAPVTLDVLPGRTHDDIVLQFDGDDDLVTPLIASFIGGL